jgi:glucose/arabinose dehydrogenase
MMTRKRIKNPERLWLQKILRQVGYWMVLGLLLAACSADLVNVGTPGETQAPSPSNLPKTPTASSTVAEAAPVKTPSPIPAAPATFPDPAGYDWAPITGGLNLPVDIQNAGDGSGRLFIVEKRGRILVLKDGSLLPVPFLDIVGEVDSLHTEQGLLGLAFHPGYAHTGLFFINYIDLGGNTVIARFHVSADDPNRADSTSEVDLLHVKQPFVNHNGGRLTFGPDGYLYIGLGDGGSAGDPFGNAQNRQSLLGKILRIDVDHGNPYAIPMDNPFAMSGGLPEIWAYGLRNPWRFSFNQRTGDLFIADVGQDAWEEVDFVPAGTPGGMNFGWNYFEAMHPYKGQPPASLVFTKPVSEYSHSLGCSVTGGFVYQGPALPEWQGVYFYGDYCSGIIWGLIRAGENDWQGELLFTLSAQISTFGLDETGEIYLADLGSGTLLKLSKKQ